MSDDKRPCFCGQTNPESWYAFGVYVVKCRKCGKEIYARNEYEALRKWNYMVRKGSHNERNQEESSSDRDSCGVG